MRSPNPSNFFKAVSGSQVWTMIIKSCSMSVATGQHRQCYVAEDAKDSSCPQMEAHTAATNWGPLSVCPTRLEEPPAQHGAALHAARPSCRDGCATTVASASAAPLTLLATPKEQMRCSTWRRQVASSKMRGQLSPLEPNTSVRKHLGHLQSEYP